ncbi:carbohydrate-binding protein [Chitinibacter sp. S2-10]|uniref:carbohydrate-binding protein n=1 Tax=Chitinibacter sp. S2-10 TaxID=3373597 RepID=UPI003977ABDE
MKKLGLGFAILLCCSLVWAQQAWQEGRHYGKGERVSYRGKNYEALQAHDAAKGANWNPLEAPALWRKIDAVPAGGTGHGWREGVQYQAGQMVIYRGQKYRCLQAHQAVAGAGWSPDQAPSLWEKLTPAPSSASR